LDNIRNELSGSVIMVTGAAGSIGSELCRQLCCFNLKQLILFDFSETATYEVDMELKKRFPDRSILPIIGDVRNRDRVESQTRLYHPDIIFHAAAYKHVPMMEKYPCEAVRTNVLGTSIMADTALKYGVKKFIMISTDKAVNPSSVMGATKRLAEMYVQSLGSAIQEGNIIGKTSFITTRFGNVLGSNGSVIPLFRQQIMEGGPVTVTHPDIIRYFMTIPEAVSLVLEAGAYAKNGQIFVLNMGDPVRIADLAKNMIRLSGYEPGVEIEIKYIGLRPGEKLYEELLMNEEGMQTTENTRIFIGRQIAFDETVFRKQMKELERAAENECPDICERVKRMVPEYQYEGEKKHDGPSYTYSAGG
jgi:FlaA1/EpsC-like NDP-sugar epimerase